MRLPVVFWGFPSILDLVRNHAESGHRVDRCDSASPYSHRIAPVVMNGRSWGVSCRARNISRRKPLLRRTRRGHPKRMGTTNPTPPYPDPVDHYANAVILTSEHCFRMIQAENGTGHAQHCP
jgi:hypothetical protein